MRPPFSIRSFLLPLYVFLIKRVISQCYPITLEFDVQSYPWLKVYMRYSNNVTLDASSNGYLSFINPTNYEYSFYGAILSPGLFTLRSTFEGYLDCRYRDRLIHSPIFSSETSVWEFAQCNDIMFMRCYKSTFVITMDSVSASVNTPKLLNRLLFTTDIDNGLEIYANNFYGLYNCQHYTYELTCKICVHPGYTATSNTACSYTNKPFGANVIAINSSGNPTRCQAGYTLSGTSCILTACLDPYATACTTPVNATSCVAGSTLFEGICSPPEFCKDMFCNVCSNKRICEACKTGYYLNGTECYSEVKPDNCLIIRYPAQCLKCQVGYKVVSGFCSSLGCSDANCASCDSSPSVCTECGSGYAVNSTDKSCWGTTCSANCFSCKVAGACSYCQAGFTLNATDGACWSNTCSLTQCKNCKTPSTCDSCNAGFYLNSTDGECWSSSCSKSNCATCKTSASCNSCSAGFYFNSTDGECWSSSCSKSNCATCKTSPVCSSCNAGFYLNSTDIECYSSFCSKSNCATCKTSPVCSSCNAGFYLNSTDGECWSSSCLKTNCATCKASPVCNSCNAGFYLNSTDGECWSSSCSKSNCVTCKTSASCNSCNAGFYLNSTDVECYSSSCSKSNCATCKTSPVCSSCNAGFYLNSTDIECYSSFCSKSNCATCKTSPVCSSCNAGFYLNSTDGECWSSSCSKANCATCKTSVSCNSCTAGFYLNSTDIECYSSSCSKSNCATCKTSSGCNSCTSGYYLNSTDIECYSSSCSKSNCATCKTSPACNSCTSGYYLNSTDGECWSSSCSKASCATCKTSSICDSCASGYYLNSTDGECYFSSCFSSSCLTCKTPSTCESCTGGYYLNTTESTCWSSTCMQSCLICPTPEACAGCAHNFYLSASNDCWSSICPESCDSCKMPDRCEVCAQDFVLSPQDGKCWYKECGEHCLKCKNQFGCYICEEGYFVREDGKCEYGWSAPSGYFWLDKKLVACDQVFDRCEECYREGCLKCKEGGILVSEQCLGNGEGGCEGLDDSECGGSKAECGEGLILFRGVCAKMGQEEGCALSWKDQCLLCGDGFELEKGICKAYHCGIDCMLCGLGGCEECVEGKELVGGECRGGGCEEIGCEECIGQAGVCTLCGTGKVLVEGGCVDGECGLVGCKRCGSEGDCEECGNGWVSIGGGCEPVWNGCDIEGCLECPHGCEACRGQRCLKCSEGFESTVDGCEYTGIDSPSHRTGEEVDCETALCFLDGREVTETKRCEQCLQFCEIERTEFRGGVELSSSSISWSSSYSSTFGARKIDVDESRLLVRLTPGARAAIFTLPSTAVTSATCRIDLKRVFAISSGGEAEDNTSSRLITSAIGSAAAVLSGIFPLIFGLLQKNLLLQYFYLVVMRPPRAFELINAGLADKKPPDLPSGFRHQYFFLFRTLWARSALVALVDPTSELMLLLLGISRCIALIFLRITSGTRPKVVQRQANPSPQSSEARLFTHLSQYSQTRQFEPPPPPNPLPQNSSYTQRLKLFRQRLKLGLTASEPLIFAQAPAALGRFFLTRLLSLLPGSSHPFSVIVNLFCLLTFSQIFYTACVETFHKFQHQVLTNHKHIYKTAQHVYLLVETGVTVISTLLLVSFFRWMALIGAIFMLSCIAKITFFLLVNRVSPHFFWKIMALSELLLFGFFVLQIITEFFVFDNEILLDVMYLSAISVQLIATISSLLVEICALKDKPQQRLKAIPKKI